MRNARCPIAARGSRCAFSAATVASVSAHLMAASLRPRRSRSPTARCQGAVAGWRWNRMLEGGQYTTLAERLGQDLSHQLRSARAVHLVARAVEDRPGATELRSLPGKLVDVAKPPPRSSGPRRRRGFCASAPLWFTPIAQLSGRFTKDPKPLCCYGAATASSRFKIAMSRSSSPRKLRKNSSKPGRISAMKTS